MHYTTSYNTKISFTILQNKLTIIFGNRYKKIICIIAVLILLYGILSMGIGIFAIIVGVSKNNANCHNVIGKLQLNVALIVCGVIVIINSLGIGSLTTTSQDNSQSFMRYFHCFAIIWLVIFSIILFTENCEHIDTTLYNTGLLIFVLQLVDIMLYIIVGCIIGYHICVYNTNTRDNYKIDVDENTMIVYHEYGRY